MTTPRVLSFLEIVNNAIVNLGETGVKLDRSDIAVIWKIVERQISDTEIQAWRLRKLSESAPPEENLTCLPTDLRKALLVVDKISMELSSSVARIAVTLDEMMGSDQRHAPLGNN